jgi:uncharacterized membrane protein YjgN (DUF898 family)
LFTVVGYWLMVMFRGLVRHFPSFMQKSWFHPNLYFGTHSAPFSPLSSVNSLLKDFILKDNTKQAYIFEFPKTELHIMLK